MAVYRCREPFTYTDHAGVPRLVHAGQLMSDADPAFPKRKHLFDPVEDVVTRSAGVVEDATAEPGVVRRGPGRPRKEFVESHD